MINNYSLEQFKFEQDTAVGGDDGRSKFLHIWIFTRKPGFRPKVCQDKLHSFAVKPPSFPRLDSAVFMQTIFSSIPVIVELTKD